MTRKQRAALNRAVQKLIDAEVAYAATAYLLHVDVQALLTCLLGTRAHYRRMLDKYTDPVVPPTKKE